MKRSNRTSRSLPKSCGLEAVACAVSGARAAGLLEHEQWLSRDLVLIISGLALVVPGALLFTQATQATSSLFAVAQTAGWLLGFVAFINAPIGRSRFSFPLILVFFMAGGLYGVLDLVDILKRINDAPSGDDQAASDCRFSRELWIRNSVTGMCRSTHVL